MSGVLVVAGVPRCRRCPGTTDVAGVVHPRVMLVLPVIGPISAGRLHLKVLRIARLGGSRDAMVVMMGMVFHTAFRVGVRSCYLPG
jgi:hypothetical protein